MSHYASSALIVAVIVGALLSAPGAAAQGTPAGDPVAGAQKTQMCTGCHGIAK